MSKRRITRNRRPSLAAFCGSLGLGVCCVLGGSGADGLVGVKLLFAQQTTSQDEGRNQVVYFTIPIGVDIAPVFASPSAKSYQTSRMSRDEVAEVYFRNADGFCAVRPPQGSFSWINSKFVELESSTSGRVCSESGKAIPARVGGASPATSSVVQVGLKDGQTVKILDEETLEDGSVWYKIAPPPGEFRWISAASLARDPALSRLPSKLTFRDEYREQLVATHKKSDAPSKGSLAVPTQEFVLPDNPQGLELPTLDANVGRPESLANARNQAPSDPNAYGRAEFQQKIASLNADVLKTLQKPNATANELDSLQARAEDLFDRAPSDSDRYFVQSIFEAVSKAQVQQQKQIDSGAAYLANARPNMPPQPNQFLPGQPNTQNFMAPNVGQFAGQPNFQQIPEGAIMLENGQIVDQSYFDNMALAFNGAQLPNGQYVVGATITSDGPVDGKSSRSGKSGSSHLGFAFSNGNNPFRKSSKENAGRPRSARMEPSLAHLPGLEREYTTEIVPPQNYRPHGAKTIGSLAGAKLAPGPLRGEQQAKPAGDAQQLAAAKPAPKPTVPTQVQQGSLVFQSPQLAANNRVNVNTPEPKSDDSTRWQAVSTEPTTPAESQILPVSGTETRETPNKIRQTSAFTPVTSQSFDNFDSAGTLIELSNVSDGAPRYALLDKTGNSFNVVAYLDAGKGVSLEKFVGQKVVVKGSTGTVTVDGNTLRHIVVSSLFLQK